MTVFDTSEINFSYFSIKTCIVTPHYNCLDVMVLMRGHNICFGGELTKIIWFESLLVL